MKITRGRGAGILAVFSLASASYAAGCENRHVLGQIHDDASTPPHLVDAMIGEPILVSPEDGGRDGGPLVGEYWTGYVENYQFPSGSDAIKIAFAVDSAGQMVGIVKLGSGTPPPPATDPNVGYPADLLTQQPLSTSSAYVAEGYSYSMRGGTRTGNRLQFMVQRWELWTGWCALQTPAPATGQCDEPVCASLCLPNRANMRGPDGCALWNPATSQYDEPVDCGKLDLCLHTAVCICDPSVCTVNLRESRSFRFDVTITGEHASGGVVGLPLGDRNVHFTKDP